MKEYKWASTQTVSGDSPLSSASEANLLHIRDKRPVPYYTRTPTNMADIIHSYLWSSHISTEA